MKDKLRKVLITLATFITVFILHIFYFKVTEGGCGSTHWLQKYIKEEEYFLGISYALSLAFMAFTFLKYAKVFEKLDKKMEEKAKSRTCCPSSSGKEKNSCCS